ncbi:MAG: 50S ribosomal protein L10 [Candidatus Micrarchaeia archaeon]
MFTKEDKKKFVEEKAKEIKNYKTIGILQVNNIPDRLIQTSRNKLKNNVKFIISKKSLLKKILESNENTKQLVDELNGTSAILLSNEDPLKLMKEFKKYELKLAAKPNQIAPIDIMINEGETNVQPGQTVTELKQAGIDVQIQKGKVIIAKSKVLVKSGSAISPAIAKALKLLDILPFKVVAEPSSFVSNGILFRKDILNITSEQVANDIAKGFVCAFNLSLKAGIVNVYTIPIFIARAYNEALYLGLERSIYEPGIAEKLVERASKTAATLNSNVK